MSKTDDRIMAAILEHGRRTAESMLQRSILTAKTQKRPRPKPRAQ